MNTPTDNWLTKVQALLDKAESTQFPAEAEALFAKAQELIAKHGIDEAVLASNRTIADEVIVETVYAEAPYATAKAILWNVIAMANNCTVIRISGKGKRQALHLFGFSSDVESVKALYAALSLHATREVTKAEVPHYDTVRAFRHAFLVSFASRIGERLQEAKATAVAEHEEATGESVALVLVERDRQVAAEVRSLHPRLTSSRTTSSSRSGYGAGRSAANRANIGQRGVSGGQRALSA